VSYFGWYQSEFLTLSLGITPLIEWEIQQGVIIE
jgi:hypothetical protein